MNFTYDSFHNLLEQVLGYGYSFLRFDEQPRGRKRIIYLRHDVDISPACALELGRIEHSLGLTANYFFQIGAETYNIFSPPTLSGIERLRDFGHCVGLHIDPWIGQDERRIRATLDWFRTWVAAVDPVVSFHRPSERVLGRSYRTFLNAYQKEFFAPDYYLSDSRRNRDFYPRLQNYLEERRTPLQLLLHPEWWHPEQDVVRFKELLVKRRVSELESYLVLNFNKVFGRLIRNDNCTFGL